MRGVVEKGAREGRGGKVGSQGPLGGGGEGVVEKGAGDGWGRKRAGTEGRGAREGNEGSKWVECRGQREGKEGTAVAKG